MADHEYLREAEAGFASCAAEILQQDKDHWNQTVLMTPQPGIQQLRAHLVFGRWEPGGQRALIS